MSIFDIVGPVMVGPSSSHTAGAVRIGYICYKLMDEPIRKVEIGLYGSFLATGKGHGTDKALVAGLLGMKPGHVTEVTSMLGHKSINIATMQLYRACPGGHAVMVLECDQEVPKESLKWLEHLEGILKVTYLSLKE